MTDLHETVRRSLGVTRERWYEGLAEPLASRAWASLRRHALTASGYGTARALACDPSAPRLGSLMQDVGLGRALPLEAYDPTMLARYGVIGLRAPRRTFDPDHFERALKEAIALVRMVPGVGEAVRALLWSVTPVDVEGPDYDTGYSDPAVPFSIFLGAHPEADAVSAVRLAEGLLHEVMHLQLSLVEDLVPLVAGGMETRHSPWQGRPRPVQGVLHGLYVFRVVQDWLGVLLGDGALVGVDLDHAHGRIARIDEECAELSDLASSEDLTKDGRALVEALTR